MWDTLCPGLCPHRGRASLCRAGLVLGCMGSTGIREDGGSLQFFSKPADFNSFFGCVLDKKISLLLLVSHLAGCSPLQLALCTPSILCLGLLLLLLYSV